MMPSCQILQGNCLTVLKTLPDESVHCVVTSPPYWGLRSYSACSCSVQRNAGMAALELAGTVTAGVSGQCSPTDPRCKKEPDPNCPKCHGTGQIEGVEASQIGLEKTLAEYLSKMVAVFEEVRRVLRSDGTVWMNLGDLYAATKGREGAGSERKYASENDLGFRNSPSCKPPAGLKPKDMVGLPWRVAFALQEAGWWLRSEIIWHKLNPLPESVTDRPTKAHETVFLLTKSAKYFYDQEAIAEPCSESTHARVSQDVENQIGSERANGGAKTNGNMKVVVKKHGQNSRFNVDQDVQHADRATHRKVGEFADGVKNNESFNEAMVLRTATRNKRTVWSIATEAFKGAHFACYPKALVKPCILAGTSAHGVCAQCRAPWKRIMEDGVPDLEHQKACGGDVNGEYHGKASKDFGSAKAQDASATKARILAGMVSKNTIGWRRTCECDCAEVVPATVMDPFAGTFTTGSVALELGRSALGIELNPDYIEMAKERCNITPGLALA